MLKRSRPRQAVFLLGLTATLLAGPAWAADTGNGSKNFRTPSSVPNYFSNEAGPMLGPASETQRGTLYGSQTAPVAAAPRQVATVPAPQPRQHIAMAEPRGRLIRGRAARVVAHHVIVHGRTVTRVAAHGSSRIHTAYVASRYTASRPARAVDKAHAIGRTRVSGRRARG